jgi:hypothetical protein
MEPFSMFVDGQMSEMCMVNLEGEYTLDESESPTNTTDGVAVADAPFKTGKFAGHDVIEVDSDTYIKCKFGKRPYAKWDGYIEDEALRTFVQKRYNTKKSLIVADKDSGAMTFLKHKG